MQEFLQLVKSYQKINEIYYTAIYHPSFYLRRGENGIKDFKKVYKLIIEVLNEQIISSF